MKIGILGGTFDPVHLGHVKICRSVMKRMTLDKLVFIPSYISPHKQGKGASGLEQRLDMLELALKEEPYFEIDDFEIKKKGISYSVDTIKYLKQKYPGCDLYWMVGADMLFYIEKWHDFRTVLDEIAFIAVGREGFENDDIQKYRDELVGKYNADIHLCRIENVDISSTDIRKRIKNNDSIGNLVHKKVEQYIIDNNLYKT